VLDTSKNYFEFTHVLINQYTLIVNVRDSRQIGIAGIIVTIQNAAKEQLCKQETTSDGAVLCVIENSKLSLGALIYIVSEDKNKVWTTITNME